ncbi:MAG: peptidoglycan editing factor PgeF [Lachnospiraceae bacterium]|nr:peptidoglycan editing factor PgeF [Lachnospiraceae bacterium]
MYEYVKKKYEYHKENDVVLREAQNGVNFFSFPALEKEAGVKHGFSTRIGGVSGGFYSSLNLSVSTGDDIEKVEENYRRMAEAIGVVPDSLVGSAQTHTVNIRKVTGEDKGKLCKEKPDYNDIDGLITNEPGITLVTVSADCILVLFYDKKHKAIGNCHSGWRGTVGKICEKTLKAMNAEYGSLPEDMICCICPGICRDCYEVSEDVAEKFYEAFDKEEAQKIVRKRTGDKYDLDLWNACRLTLLKNGVKEENIHVSDVCTRCNKDLLYSHRVTGIKRGSLAAFIGLEG